MNLHHLRYFAELARTGHYTRASEELCISQPSLSHAIRQLEEELGVPLFEKNGRNTTLTCFGVQFLECVENILKTLDTEVENLKRSAKGAGTIRLGFLRILGVHWLPALAERFLKNQEPDSIHFTFHSGATEDLLKGLRARHYDLVFCSHPNDDTGLLCIPVIRQKLVLIVPEKHPLSEFDSVSLEETLEYPFIYFAKSSGLRYDIDGLFRAVGRQPKIMFETEEDQVIAGLTSRGFGIAIVPEMEILKELHVKQIQISHPCAERIIYMICNSHIFTPPAVENFRQFVIKLSAKKDSDM